MKPEVMRRHEVGALRLGHALGACTALETAVVLACMAEGFFPGSVNLERLDAECTLDLLRPPGRCARVGLALVHSASFGGRNAALVLAALPAADRLV